MVINYKVLKVQVVKYEPRYVYIEYCELESAECISRRILLNHIDAFKILKT